MKVINVVGARPNFMKVAPILAQMKLHPDVFSPILLHTGQHYDYEMSKVFFDDLRLPEPDIYLGIGSGTHAEQTAKVMVGFEKAIREESPDLVLVVGDVNSTLAVSIVAAKLLVPIAHVEAGLRSFDRTMPEEINRIVTDCLSSYLFTPCREAEQNLEREGIDRAKVFFVGNVMIDSLLACGEKASSSDVLERFELKKSGYVVLTLHRPRNVDDRGNFMKVLEALEEIQKRTKVIYPAHPRAKKQVEELGLGDRLRNMKNLTVINPVGHSDFVKLMMNARFVMTDSGGIQEETTVLGIPCLTLRENTERPVTVEIGTNTLTGLDVGKIVEESVNILEGQGKRGGIPELWDGKAAERIVRVLQGI